MAKPFVAITHAQNIDLHFFVGWHFEGMSKAVCVSSQDQHVTAKLRQAVTQTVSGAYGPTIRVCRMKGRAHMKDLHTTKSSEAKISEVKAYNTATSSGFSQI